MPYNEMYFIGIKNAEILLRICSLYVVTVLQAMERQNNRPVVFDGIGKSVLNQEQRRLAPLLEDFSATHFL